MYEDSMSIRKPFGRLHNNESGWTDGEVVTPYGIVSVYAQGDKENWHLTRLDFAHKNRMYIRSFRKRYTHRGIVTKANRFAQEIVEGL